jgi:hypothetical protein
VNSVLRIQEELEQAFRRAAAGATQSIAVLLPCHNE